MTRFTRLIRKLLERLLGVWHEGPEPPLRLREQVRLFRHMYPNATPAEWERYAVKIAESSWRDAFIRGFEWNERCWPEPHVDSAAVARELRLKESIAGGSERMRRLLATEPRGMSAEQARLLKELNESPYPVQIVFEPDD